METPSANPAPASRSLRDRSTILRFIRWLCRPRTLWRLLISLAWITTLIALLYAEENWRGRRAWNRYRQSLEAKGVPLDFRAFIPKPVPDDQNFATTPFLTYLFESKRNRYDWEDAYSGAFNLVRRSDQGRREFVDLVVWSKALEAVQSGKGRGQKKMEPGPRDPASRAAAAPAILEALKIHETDFDQLRAASTRPYSRYPIQWNLDDPWGILLPHLSTIKAVVQRLQLRACAELATGQVTNAWEDLKLMLHLADSVKEEPTVVSYLVRIACLQICLQPIWEGLAGHHWSATQLQELQDRFQGYQFIVNLKFSIDAERASCALLADLLYEQKYQLSALLSPAEVPPLGTPLANLLGRIAPHGWYYLEQVNFIRIYERQSEGTYDPIRKRVFPAEVQRRRQELEKEIAGGRLGRTLGAVLSHTLLAAQLTPALDKLPLQAARAQVAADQAALACALERHRLAHGQFPEKLEMLVPAFLAKIPADPLSGEPYRYRRADPEQFLLYSVGGNEKDDGGLPGEIRFDEKQHDWVWESK